MEVGTAAINVKEVYCSYFRWTDETRCSRAARTRLQDKLLIGRSDEGIAVGTREGLVWRAPRSGGEGFYLVKVTCLTLESYQHT